jgi:hypothetical protein
MSSRITADVLEAFLHCRYKGHLMTQAGRVGTRSDYEILTAEQRAAVRQQAVERVTDRHAAGDHHLRTWHFGLAFRNFATPSSVTLLKLTWTYSIPSQPAITSNPASVSQV